MKVARSEPNATPTSVDGAAVHPGEVVYDSVSKVLGRNTVLSEVSLVAHGGETTCLIGPSGAGKSTLLRCTNLLEVPDGGALRIGGLDICAPNVSLDDLRTRVGIVFQSFNLLPHFSVLKNVSFALHHVVGLSWEAANERASQRLDEVGLLALRDRQPASLSGGQQQRVAIARALALEPQVMLFDEATSALDPELVKGVLALMKDLSGRGITMIIVTHELRYAREAANQIAFLDKGRLLECGSPEQIFEEPQNARLKQFLGQML